MKKKFFERSLNWVLIIVGYQKTVNILRYSKSLNVFIVNQNQIFIGLEGKLPYSRRHKRMKIEFDNEKQT